MLQSQRSPALPKTFLSYSYWGASTDTALYCSPGTDTNSHDVPATCLLRRLVHKSLPCHAFIYLCLWCTYAPSNQLHQKLPHKPWQHQHVIHNAGLMPWKPYGHCLSSSCAINNKNCQFPSFQPNTFFWHAYSEPVMSPLTRNVLRNRRITTEMATTASKLRQPKGTQENSLWRCKVVKSAARTSGNSRRAWDRLNWILEVLLKIRNVKRGL